MARTEITLTNTFQQISTKRCVVTFKANGVHAFNTTATDSAALVDNFNPDDQVIQNEVIAVFAKTLSGDAVIVVDEEA